MVEVAPRIGELRIKDVRVALGHHFFELGHVDVLVLGRPGEPASTGRVFLTDAAGGLGTHRRLVCPKCLTSKKLLMTDGAGGFACARCLRRRTRRQLERSHASWHRFGGKLEDKLFRRLTCPGSRTPAATAQTEHLVQKLVAGDLDLLFAIVPDVRAALDVADRARDLVHEERRGDDEAVDQENDPPAVPPITDEEDATDELSPGEEALAQLLADFAVEEHCRET